MAPDEFRSRGAAMAGQASEGGRDACCSGSDSAWRLPVARSVPLADGEGADSCGASEVCVERLPRWERQGWSVANRVDMRHGESVHISMHERQVLAESYRESAYDRGQEKQAD
jgi:hypothetical protein